MRVPIRKPGKYTHQKADPYITQEKYSELQNNLERMKGSRPRLASEVKRLAANGDFSENAEYQIAKGRLRGLNQRIIETEDHLKRAIIIQPSEIFDTVQLGSRVTVESNGKEKTYLILGSSEVNLDKNIISYNSPIGSALIGKRVGDEIIIRTGKEKRYIIKNIE